MRSHSHPFLYRSKLKNFRSSFILVIIKKKLSIIFFCVIEEKTNKGTGLKKKMNSMQKAYLILTQLLCFETH